MSAIYTLNAAEQRYNGRTVLHVEKLDILNGEVLAFVGPSGAGKSTLLRLLAMLEAPASGTVSLHMNQYAYQHDNIPLPLKRDIAMVFQRPVLMSRSVFTNVAYGLKLRGEKNIQEQVEAMLESVRLAELANARPHTLSGGELQRVSIARAMILQPRILILDEPTANLDPYNIEIIENLIRAEQERRQLTVVIVTHNIFQAKRLADRVALIYNHELVEVAETESFFNQPTHEFTKAFIAGQIIY